MFHKDNTSYSGCKDVRKNTYSAHFYNNPLVVYKLRKKTLENKTQKQNRPMWMVNGHWSTLNWTAITPMVWHMEHIVFSLSGGFACGHGDTILLRDLKYDLCTRRNTLRRLDRPLWSECHWFLCRGSELQYSYSLLSMIQTFCLTAHSNAKLECSGSFIPKDEDDYDMMGWTFQATLEKWMEKNLFWTTAPNGFW